MSTETNAIRSAIDSASDDITALLEDLIRFPTCTPPGTNYDWIVEQLKPLLQTIGIDIRRCDMPQDVFKRRCQSIYPEIAGTRANLLGRMPGVTQPAMLWYCHLDTVPAGDPASWSRDPFEPYVHDGYVYGRGAADSKGGAVAILSAFRVLHSLRIEPRVSPVVALTTDEEIGPYSGLMYLCDQGEFADCGRFHSCEGIAGFAGVGSLGAFNWRLTVNGKSVHSGSSYLGVNAIERGAPLLDEILRLKQTVEARTCNLPNSPESAEATGRKHIGSLLNTNIAHGGIKHNIVPNSFVLEGDRRFIPEEDEQDCIREHEDAVDRARVEHPQLNCSLDIYPFYPSFAQDPKQEWIQAFCQLASPFRGTEIGPACVSGSTDVAYAAQQTGIPTVMNGMARHADTRNHGVDERARVSDLLDLTKIVALLATSSPSI